METVDLSDQQLRARNTSTLTGLRRFTFPVYWKCGKFLGGAGLFVLAILLVTGHVPHPVVVAVLLHIAGDFTLQSPETAQRKHERGRHLLVHALAAGGLPLAAAGLAAGNLGTVLVWATIGIVSHYIVDWTRRFGMDGRPWGVIFDQACHLLIIFALVLMT